MTTRKREFGENPASLNSIDITTFQDPRKLRPIQSFRGTHYNDVAEFVAELRAAGGIAAAAFEFMILTASRPSEALGARYDEFNFDEKIWTVPKIRLKPTGAERHVVPLSERAVEIVNTQIRLCDYVFPQRMQDKPITNHALFDLILKLKGARSGISAHGFRSTFSTWSAAKTNFKDIVTELSLSHRHGTRTSQVYRDDDEIDGQRRTQAEVWALWCNGEPVPDDFAVKQLKPTMKSSALNASSAE